LRRIDKDLHTIIVETLGLDHIQHVEFDFEAFTSIRYPEVEPLSVAFGVDVVLENQVVLLVALLVSKLEITRFEARFKN
jgi:hypothetical protein